MGRTIANLLIALLNATLILVALCLFLALQLSHRVEEVTRGFASSLLTLDPVRDQIAEMTEEVTGLRGDLRALREDGSAMTGEAAERITARIDQLEGRLDAVSGRIGEVLESPEALVDHAVDRAAEEIRQGIGEWRGCAAPEELSRADLQIFDLPRNFSSAVN